MIAYTVLGTNDLEKSAAFYDALLAETINSNQQVVLEQFETLSNGLEQKVVASAAKRRSSF